MAKLDREQIRKLAELAHLALSDEECDHFSRELDQIVAYAERIQALETEGVAPTSHALLEEGREGPAELRADEPRPGLDRDDVMRGAPDDGEGLFKVPKVLP